MSELSQPDKPTSADPAANIARAKIEELYKKEPNASEELSEANEIGGHRSKHQQFMYDLSTSGKSLADIQTEWHQYYTSLPDDEKHAVWQEFYAEHGKTPHLEKPQHRTGLPAHHMPPSHTSSNNQQSPQQTTAEIKKHIVHRALSRAKLPKNHHVRSILFGLSMGALVVLILLFSFFNDRFIAPFITPSRSVSSTPIIIDPNNTSTGSQTEIIIPKINVEIPVIYDSPSSDEKDIQKALERGVVHYPTTPNPGERGNAVIVGHSSNNIFNSGKYKFAFVLLKRLEEGDTFYVTKGGTRYAYRVFSKKIVSPDEISVLGNAGKTATVSLITCDPPGTSLHRLVVVGEQITPKPSTNKKSSVQSGSGTNVLPGNAPTLWSRLKDWLFN
jgi:sortase A